MKPEILIIIPTHKERRSMFLRLLGRLRETILLPGWQVSLLAVVDHPRFSIPWPMSPPWKFCQASYASRKLGCDRNVMRGWSLALQRGSEWIINLEDDALLHPAWLQILMTLPAYGPLAAGYGVYNSCKHHGKSGPEIQHHGFTFHLIRKNTVGGFGLMLRHNRLRSLVERYGLHPTNWDWNFCSLAQQARWPLFLTTTPSFLQHNGSEGTHTSARSDPSWDRALDFMGET